MFSVGTFSNCFDFYYLLSHLEHHYLKIRKTKLKKDFKISNKAQIRSKFKLKFLFVYNFRRILCEK